MMRALIFAQILTLGATAVIGWRVFGCGGDGCAATETTPGIAPLVLEDPSARPDATPGGDSSLAALREENQRLLERIEELEVEVLSIGATLDGVQGMVLRQAVGRAPMAVPQTGSGDTASMAMTSDTGESVVQEDALSTSATDTALMTPATVTPEFDGAVREVLARMDEERRLEREQRIIEREQRVISEAVARFSLSASEAYALETAYSERAIALRDTREKLESGIIDRERGRENTREANQSYAQALSASLGEERARDVERFVDRSLGWSRGPDRRPDGGERAGGGGQRAPAPQGETPPAETPREPGRSRG